MRGAWVTILQIHNCRFASLGNSYQAQVVEFEADWAVFVRTAECIDQVVYCVAMGSDDDNLPNVRFEHVVGKLLICELWLFPVKL